jgi:hypothetical protein
MYKGDKDAERVGQNLCVGDKPQRQSNGGRDQKSANLRARVSGNIQLHLEKSPLLKSFLSFG